uniref:Uncharacterized protein n=1 Tax=Ditylenchus dipsaci TaxID=166011 RepID=A0A915DIK2_9BILA
MIRLTRKSSYWLSSIRSLCQIVPASSTAIACIPTKERGNAKDEETRRRGREEMLLKKIRNSVKEDIIKKLAHELQREQHSNIRRNRLGRALASVANFIRQEDLSNLIEFANTYYEHPDRTSKPNIFEDELCAVILNYASSVHKGDCTYATTVNEQTSFFPRFMDPKTDPIFSKIAFALCLHWLDEWLRLESNSEVRDEFSPRLIELKRKFSTELLKDPKQPEINRMMFSRDEYAIACQVANMCQVDWDPEKSFQETQCDLGYSESLSIFSKGLCQPTAYSSPSDSPFVLPFKTKDDYMKLFSDQMKTEEQNVLKIQNFDRSSLLPSMEEMIQKWGWSSKIKAALVEKREALGDEELKSFLEHIDMDVAADQLMDCILSILSKSQNVVSLSQLQNQMCRVLLKLVRKQFLAKMGLEHREIFEEVFSKYIEYFTDEAKFADANCSIREWWHKCASASGLDPEFYAPFAKLIASPPERLDHC